MTFRWKIAQAAEIRWWQNYLKNKPTTDYAAWKKTYWLGFLEKIGLKNTLDTEGVVFDAGCGPAGIFMVFDNKQVDALDPLLSDYEKKLPHFKPSEYPNTRFFAQSLESFDKKNAYDTVFCLNAINHVADLSRSFDVLVDSAKKGGLLVVSIDAHNHRFLKKIFQALPGDILHPHQFDLQDYSQMLTERGCTIEKTILIKPNVIFNYYVLVARKNVD